jgi:hypothetical protein
MPARLTPLALEAALEQRGLCQQSRCQQDWATYCPLCLRLLCREHDELYPRRRHDCLKGPADA